MMQMCVSSNPVIRDSAELDEEILLLRHRIALSAGLYIYKFHPVYKVAVTLSFIHFIQIYVGC